MAEIIQTITLNDEMIVVFTFDDVTMRMVKFNIINNSSSESIRVDILSPIILSQSVGNIQKTLTYIFPVNTGPLFHYISVIKDWGIKQLINGIEWRVYYGI